MSKAGAWGGEGDFKWSPYGNQNSLKAFMHGIKQLSQEIDVFENKDMVLWFAAEIFLASWVNWSDYQWHGQPSYLAHW